ncbi:DUF6544 family protein [Clostridium sp. 'White wine YQ']|uniref:DUF6544 family protein n=1 Tax=Clostridium sp. 'White wine YQ' TaxID=3027474 RepID=UPI002365B578|nr:DUF6544 family protein [Clostridium sp. 'White wine YQ']MDD7794284.1 hypothetical protein [Clostridium sp. 'White wine YQ']
MYWILGIIILIILCLLAWFNISYSPVKAEFKKYIHEELKNSKTLNENFTEEDIRNLPLPVQKYFRYCGYIGKPKMANVKIYFKDVDFVQASRKLKIEYTLCSFAHKPTRFALINTSLMGIPFEGLDSYKDGVGGMKGQIAKLITLFNERGKAMDKACLATYLSEGLIIPSVALQDFVTWESIDENHAKATITYYGIKASGVFTFDDNGCMIRFTTEDREYNDGKGNSRIEKWSAICGEYKEVNGIKYPSVLQGVWNFEKSDLVYFDGKNMKIEYDVRK